MTVLETIFASGGSDVVIPTIEITCAAWSETLLLCNGFEDHVCIDETGRGLFFVASPIEFALPKKDSTGAQVLRFAIDNITGEGQRLIDEALEAGEQIFITFRLFLESNKSTPADVPMRFIVRDGSINGSVIQIDAAFFDMLNTAWPRRFYTADFAPGLKYFR